MITNNNQITGLPSGNVYENNLANINIKITDISKFGFGLWCITPLSTIVQLYYGGQFYWWRYVNPATIRSFDHGIVFQSSIYRF
jgi:hypothetical protein